MTRWKDLVLSSGAIVLVCWLCFKSGEETAQIQFHKGGLSYYRDQRDTTRHCDPAGPNLIDESWFCRGYREEALRQVLKTL